MLIENVAVQNDSTPFQPTISDPAPPSSTLSALFAGQRVERLEPGSTLFWQGDQATHVFEVTDGVLRIVHALSAGRRVIAGFLFAGDLVGVGVPGSYPYTVEVAAPAKVRRLSWHRFEEGLKGAPALRGQLVERLCNEMATVQSQVLLLAHRSAEERLCGFLMSMARRMSGGATRAKTIDLSMSRLDIADYLGLTSETISRTMTRLRTQGVIAQFGRYTVVVRRPDRLAALAAEEEGDADAGASLRLN